MMIARHAMMTAGGSVAAGVSRSCLLWRRAPLRSLAIESGKQHETWRDEHEVDNLPKVRRRDGTIADIDKTRGFVDYYRNPDPYRDPLEVRPARGSPRRAAAPLSLQTP